MAVTVLMICKSPPGATAGHNAFASETTLFQSYSSPRFCKFAIELDDAVGIGAHALPLALTLKSDSIGVAAGVGNVKMISPVVTRSPLAVAVEKRIELRLSIHKHGYSGKILEVSTYPVTKTLTLVGVVLRSAVVGANIAAVTGFGSSLAVTKTIDGEF